MIEFNKEGILGRGGLKMTLQQILYAITISEFGSMNKAAEALFIAQPTLTNAIKELEREVGISISEERAKAPFRQPRARSFWFTRGSFISSTICYAANTRTTPI